MVAGESGADALPALVRAVDAQGDCTFTNTRWHEFTGQLLEETAGEGWAQALHPADRDHCLGQLRALAGTRKTLEITYRLRRSDGTHGWVVERTAPQLGADGEVTGWLSAGLEITGLKLDEQALARSHQSLVRVHAVTEALAAATDPSDVVQAVLSEAAQALGADGAAAALRVPGSDEVEILGALGYDDEEVDRLRRLPADAPLPLANAIQTGETVSFTSPGGQHEQPDRPDGWGSPARHGAVLAAPMEVDGQVVGALGFSFGEPRHLHADEITLAESIAGQCAQALARVRSFRELARSQRRLEFLAEASRRLGATLDPQKTAQALADLCVPTAADWALVHLPTVGETATVAAIAHTDAERVRAALALRRHVARRGPVGVGAALRTGEIQRLDAVPDALFAQVADGEEHLAALRALEIGAALVVPLTVRGDVLATLTLANHPERGPVEVDGSLLEDLAARAASALDNARLFAERSHVARCLQETLLPPSLPVVPNVELGARYVAAGEGAEVGGDFYDVFAAERGRWVLAVGDVRGKGVEAAATTGLARHTIRAAAVDDDSPAQILRHLNESLRRHAVDDGDSSEDDLVVPRFCTACVATITPRDGGVRAVISSAGHPLPVVITADGEIRSLGSPGTLAGVLAEPDLDDVTTELDPGDVLVCVTDGVLERHLDGRFFEDVYPEVLRAGRHLSAPDLAEHIEVAARAFVDAPLEDDMAILVLRVPAP